MGQNRFPEERKRDWLGALLKCGFGCCEEHKDIRFNEKNVFCIDCVAGLCRHCKEAHSLHRRFQIYKYSYQDVVRHYDLQKYFDCSNIQVLFSLVWNQFSFLTSCFIHCIYVLIDLFWLRSDNSLSIWNFYVVLIVGMDCLYSSINFFFCPLIIALYDLQYLNYSKGFNLDSRKALSFNASLETS